MSLFGFLHRSTAGTAAEPAAHTSSAQMEIPLFPLSSVLFPGGILTLKVFEQRYLDMAAECMKQSAPFGVCLIASGKEVGGPATPHAIGTLAHIVEADMPQLGILMLKVQGGQRFRIASSPTAAAKNDGLLRANVKLIEDKSDVPVPSAHQHLIPLLRKIVNDLGPEKMPEPHDYDNANWVGYRLTEILSVQMLAKQKLLELDDPLSRLEILHTYLAQRKLVE